MDKFAAETRQAMGEAPATQKDFRKILEQKDVDAISIASPDHWHTPMAIAGLQAGKHVYVEKPCSHNPAEGALLVEAQKKYDKVVQMGTQQRSSPHTIEIIDKIHGGLIGRAYYAKAWYSNTRKTIGTGKPAPVPAQLDWELVARTGAPQALHRQRSALQLALVQDLWHRGSAQQRNPRGGCLPLGARRGLSPAGYCHRWPIPVPG